MFSLLLSILSILLVGLLVAATFFYVGDTSEKGEEAKIARKVNEASQIAAAVQMANLDGKDALTVTSLIDDGYLRGRPSGWGEDVTFFEFGDSLTASSCEQFNIKQGYSFSSVPSCTDPEIATYNRGVCCQE